MMIRYVPAGPSTARVAPHTAVVLAALLAGCGAVARPGPVAPVTIPGAVATIPVGTPPTLLAISPDGSRLFASSSGQLAIIDTASNTVVTTVKTPPYPTGVVVTPDGRRVLLDNVETTRLVVVDAATGAVRPPIDLIVDIHPGGFGRIAVTPDGRRAYVTNQPKQYLAVADLAAGNAVESTLDMRPIDVAVSRDGATLYIAGCKEFCTTGTIQLIDTTSGALQRSYNVGPSPYRIVLSPDGRRAYTTNLGGPSLSVVDLTSGATLATLPVGVEPTGLAISPDGTRVWVANSQQGTITVVDATRNVVAGTVQLPREPREIVVAPDGRHLYVSIRGAVVVLDDAAL
jgi:YVTN family beta-propeller protein